MKSVLKISVLFLKKYGTFFSIQCFLILIFFLSLKDPKANLDIWFHIKSGQIILMHGITHVDYFSFVTKGREWYPYEWLFQAIVYLLNKNLGFSGIEYFISACIVFAFAGIIAIQRYIFRLPFLISSTICFCLFVWLYSGLFPRPGTVILGFFVWNLFFIFLYIFRHRNFLWVTLFISLIWMNTHASVILDLSLFIGYTSTSLFLFLKTKKNEYKNQAKQLILYTLMTVLITVSPPLWTTQYRLLLLFAKYNNLFLNLINEWLPIWKAEAQVTIPIILIVGCSLIFWVSTMIYYKKIKLFLYSLPLLAFVVLAFLSTRNQYISFISCALLITVGISMILPHIKISSKYFIGAIILLIAIHLRMLYGLYQTGNTITFPEKAVNFIKTHDFRGNIYNPFELGGYMMYQLYPEKKVFMDGRLDLYACCELTEDYKFLTFLKTNPSQSKIKQTINNMFVKHNISYVILATSNDDVQKLITSILLEDTHWKIVYWDDLATIFVKNNMVNSDILRGFAANAVNPLAEGINPLGEGVEPYKPGMSNQALNEYEKMSRIADSAITEVSISQIALEEKNFLLARKSIYKAISINPTNSTLHLFAGKVFIQSQDYQAAINEYMQAIQLDDTQPFPYLQLGKIYAGMGNILGAQEILLKGENMSTDNNEKAQFETILHTL